MSAEESLAEVLAAEVVEALRKTWRGDYSAQMIADIAARALLASPVLQGLREQAVIDFAQWVASNRAYNGSDAYRGQSLYNECINEVLPTWATEYLHETYRRTEPTT